MTRCWRGRIPVVIWDAIRYECDRRDATGQFILTGSAAPLDREKKDRLRHSGIGRISRLNMRPMSLFESGDSGGGVSLSELFSGEKISYAEAEKSLREIAFLLCRGGWPRAVTIKQTRALDIAYEYYDGLVNEDINKADEVRKDPQRVDRLMRSYARHLSTQAAISTMKEDMRANEKDTLDEDTIRTYISALKRLFVVEELEAWNPNIRSKTAIRTSPTRHFTDPSIACAALGAGPEDLLNDPETFGLFFESMCIRDLRSYAGVLDGKVYHYRDSSGLEADAVVHLRDGRWGAVEVKLESPAGIDEGARHLLKLADRIDQSKMKEPSFLLVLTATGYAYQRDDGVCVVPLAALKP